MPNKNLWICFFALILLSQTNSFAQPVRENQKNVQVVKMNLLALITRDFSFQYERQFASHFSAALGFRFQPYGNLPFRKTILDQVSNSGLATRDFINTAKVSNWAVTPELRYYFFKKKPLNGLYVGPYFRIGEYRLGGTYLFVDDSGDVKPIVFKGKGMAWSVGIQVGAQWKLSEKISLDWWILGPQYGVMNTKLHADVDLTDLDYYEKKRLNVVLNGVSIGGNTMTSDIRDYSIDSKINLKFVGLRTGLSLGFVF